MKKILYLRWCLKVATKSLFQEMVDIQVDGVGEVGDLIAEVESVGVGFVNQRLWH